MNNPVRTLILVSVLAIAACGAQPPTGTPPADGGGGSTDGGTTGTDGGTTGTDGGTGTGGGATSALGIPDPQFCVGETPPAPPAGWPDTEAAGFYYVDDTASGATDTGNPYGTPKQPRLTPPSALPAGAYVEIHGGPYAGSSQTLTASGTAASPVWFRGASAASRPTFHHGFTVQGSYVYVENLRFDTSGQTISVRDKGTPTDHVCIRNNEFAGPGTADGNNAAIFVSGVAGAPTDQVVIYDNLIHDFGDKRVTVPENDYHGVLPGAYATHVWVLGNEIYDQGGDAIQIGQANYTDAERPDFVYVGGNRFHDCRENAVDIKAANDIIVSQNTMHGFTTSTSSAGAVVVIHDGSRQVWVLFNTVYQGDLGIISTGSTDTWFIGNVIYDIHHVPGTPWDPASSYASGAAIHFRGQTTGGAVFNTLYDYDIGIQLAQGQAGYDLEDNILSGRSEPTGEELRIASSSIATASTFDHNLLYGKQGDVRLDWASSTPVDLAGLQASAGACMHCPAPADPLFANAPADFSIPGSSPAVNGAVASAAAAAFQQRYGLSIDYDFAGKARVHGARPDIGAYESDAP